jgi:tetratricopeptide (TPR) repeat protein
MSIIDMYHQARILALSEGVNLKNKGNEAVKEEKYAKAIRYMRQSMVLNEKAFGLGQNNSQSMSTYVAYVEAQIAAQNYKDALEMAERFHKIAKMSNDKEKQIKIAIDLISEINQVSNLSWRIHFIINQF